MRRHTFHALILSGMLFPQLMGQPESDAPGRGVARLSLLNGDVSVRRGDTGDWVAAAVNAPVLAEDRVFSAASSRAEVQFDYYHRIRLAAETEVRLTELEKRRYQMQLARGTVTFTALKGGDAQVEINTPGAAVRPIAHGSYRITVLADGSSEITVRIGEAEVFTPKGSHRLRPGRTMIVGSDEPQIVAEIAKDAWDDFNRSRDKELASRAGVYQYVSRDIYGAEDLDGHGEWVDVAPYGMVWRPYTAPGWAPYRHGRWTWLDWYGWSWVSYDPWGWAPFHYGRWFWGAGSWCWSPGPVYYSHWWRPGLVAWFGWGGFGVGVGFGNWGWVPLAPFEPYYPWYGRGLYGGYRNVNVYKNVHIVNNTNIYNNYRNARIDGSVTTVTDLSRGAPGRAMRGGELERASLMQGSLPVAPVRESLRLADREVSAPHASREDGAFYSRREVARVDRVPFESQRQALEQYTRQAVAEEGRRTGAIPATRADGGRTGWRTVQPESRGAAPEGSRSTSDGSDWRRFGEPNSRSVGEVIRSAESAGRTSEPRSESRTGWRTFGEPGSSTAATPETRGTQSDDSWRRGGVWRSTTGSESPRSESRADSNRSEGYRSDGGSRRSETAVQAAPSRDSSWSTGRGSGDASRSREAAAPPSPSRSAEPPARGSDAPSRSAEPQAPGRGDGGGRSRGNDSAGFYHEPGRMNGSWSTGGGWAAAPSQAPVDRSGNGSYGGGSSRSNSGFGSYSSGGGRIESYGGTGRSNSGFGSSGGGTRMESYGGLGRRSGGFGGYSSSGGGFGGSAGRGGGMSSGGMSGGGFGGSGGRGGGGGMSSGGMSSGGGGGFSGGTGRSGGGGRSR